MGKLSTENLKKLLDCIRSDPSIVIPPLPGFDSGVHRIDDKYLVISTDPCIGVPATWFGWLLLNYAASDVALFGAYPQFCTINLLGPVGTAPEIFRKIMKQTCEAADELHAAILTGHTGTYKGLSTIVGVCTAYGIIEKEKLITPADCKPSDSVLCIKTIGSETATNFALTKKNLASRLFGAKGTQKLARSVKKQSCVREATLLADLKGVNAMHDATEGGIVSAINEMADASKLGFQIDEDTLPIPQEIRTLQKHFGLTNEQIFSISSTGTILAAVNRKDEDSIMKRLSEDNIESRIIGFFTKDRKRLLKADGRITAFPREADDPYQKIVT